MEGDGLLAARVKLAAYNHSAMADRLLSSEPWSLISYQVYSGEGAATSSNQPSRRFDMMLALFIFFLKFDLRQVGRV
jgi:hypothetical protein